MSGPDETPLQRRGAEVIRALHRLVHAAPLGPGEASPGQDLDQALAAWAAAGGAAMEIQLAGGGFYVNGQLLRLDAWTRGPARALAARLEAVGAWSLSLSPGAGGGDFASDFGRDLAEAHRRRVPLVRGAYTGVSLGLGPVLAEGTAYRVARRYGALVEATAEVERRLSARALPALLPLRRALQDVAEDLDSACGAYQAAAAYGAPRGSVSAAAAIGVDAMGFGDWSGLSMAEVVNLGLSAVISGVLQAEAPARAARVALALEGAGAAGEAMVLALYDARTARRGALAGAPGRLLALVERYMERTGAGEAPRAVLADLRAGGEPQIDTRLAILYGRWKLGWLPSAPASVPRVQAPPPAPTPASASKGPRRILADDRWMALPAGDGGTLEDLPPLEE